MSKMSEMERLKTIIERLRAKDGCPWDSTQTHESIKAMCIEEAAEVVCGINILTATGDPENLREELGDLLFQVIFHASLAEEEGLFTLEDVAKTAADKMVRRHGSGERRRLGGDQTGGKRRTGMAGAVSGSRHGRGKGTDRRRREAQGI